MADEATNEGERASTDLREDPEVAEAASMGGGGVPGVPDGLERTAAAAATVVRAAFCSESSFTERVIILA